jgi:hypothetical protein
MIWVRFGFMTEVKVTDNGSKYQFGSNGGTSVRGTMIGRA